MVLLNNQQPSTLNRLKPVASQTNHLSSFLTLENAQQGENVTRETTSV